MAGMTLEQASERRMFSDLRRILLYLCVTGMDAAWFALPLSLLWAAQPFNLVVLWGALILGIGLALGLLEWINRAGIQFPLYPLLVAGLVVGSALGIVWAGLYRALPFWDGEWLTRMLYNLLLIEAWPCPELPLLLINFFVWQRATWGTRRLLDLRDVTINFWMGLFFLVSGGVLWRFIRGEAAPSSVVWGYFGLGMTSLALARFHHVPLLTRSVGQELSRARVGQLGVLVGGTLLLALGGWWILSVPLERIAEGLGPLWNLLFILVQVIVVILFYAGLELWKLIVYAFEEGVAPALERLEDTVRSVQAVAQQIVDQAGLNRLVIPPWIWLALRVGVVVLIVGGALAAVLVFLGVIQPPRLRRGQEDAEAMHSHFNLWAGLESLRAWGRLMRRYGFNRNLLAAISVQNLYANLCRLARRRGYPRKPSQPPDRYLPRLIEAFEGEAESLQRITEAYMQVHYGDREITGAELAQLRADYARVRRNVR